MSFILYPFSLFSIFILSFQLSKIEDSKGRGIKKEEIKNMNKFVSMIDICVPHDFLADVIFLSRSQVLVIFPIRWRTLFGRAILLLVN